ncbi:ribokinase [Alsobacter metallidurans]|uniref:Ribokinase n=1 Tax=Alsobacter metallidurans TaxID=340221 RepID=A0A917MIR3_9HYPH|nr:carbohydrate kinase family protein [Alsobacter metallidurans]GGH22120.1 ribokinase [Alsobacter metallidurans]
MTTPFGGDAGLLLCIGRIYCDLVFRGFGEMPRLGEERFADDFAVAAGGGAFITAARAASLGAPASLLGRLGVDPLAEAIAPMLEASGVDLRFLERAADAGPQLTVAMVQGGERAFLSRRAGSGRPATLEAALASPAPRWLHVAEFATVAEIPDLLPTAAAAGLSISLDPSWDDALIRSPDLLDRCAGVEVFLPNAAEARVIARCEDLGEAGRRLASRFPTVVIKTGADGAILHERGEMIVLKAPRGGPLVDTTGAGDSFNAGFLAASLMNRRPREALAWGIACGTLSVRAVGGAGLRLDLGEVEAMAHDILREADHG